MMNMEEYQIGNTPLIGIGKHNSNRIMIKLESRNFLGSIKARSAYYMVNNLPDIAKDRTIIESTSGNLGFALGFFCEASKRNFLALVDPSIAAKKLKRLEQYSIKYKVIDAIDGLDYRSSRILTAKNLHESGAYYWINQYDNPFNVQAHESTTAPEIWKQTKGEVTHVVCAMGSCGTICGIGRYFHKVNPNVKVIGVEPYGSTIFGKINSTYLNVGAGMAEKPGNLIDNPNTIDSASVVKDVDSIKMANEIFNRYNLNVGITSGMAYFQAIKLAESIRDSLIVVVAPDGRDSYAEYL